MYGQKDKYTHFKTCKRCRVNYKGSKFSKVCVKCNNNLRQIKLKNIYKYQDLVEDRLDDFKPKGGVL